MISRIVKMSFSGSVHFGEGLLETSGQSICADTLFSAICHEILLISDESKLLDFISETKKGALRISDAFPFIGTEYYIPKPVIGIRGDAVVAVSDSSEKKQYKKLRFLPLYALHSYLLGKLSTDQCAQINKSFEAFGNVFLKRM